MNRFNIQLAKTIVPILLSVLSFGLGMWSKMANGLLLQNSTTEWVGFILIALLIPLYTIQISIQLSLYPDLNSIAGDIGKAISEGKVVYVGNAVEAAPIVIDRLKTASEALNTYLISDEVPFPKKISELVEGGIRGFVKRNDTSFEETCSEKGKERADNLKKNFNGTLPTSYKVRVINKSEFPACNFIILTRKASDPIPQEIFFGWGFFRGNHNESVFWSNDKDLIGFFKGYHKALRTNDISSSYKP